MKGSVQFPLPCVLLLLLLLLLSTRHTVYGMKIVTSPAVTATCPSSGLPSVAHSGHNGDGIYVEGDVLTYTCSRGYVFQNWSEVTVMCALDGTFIGNISACVKICPSIVLPLVAHSTHGDYGIIVEGDVITYTCNTGYVFQDGSQFAVTCSPDGSFLGTISPCIKVCPSSGLPTVDHSSHDGDGTCMAGDVVMYTCDANYYLKDASQNTQTCTVDGTFSGTVPSCLQELKYECDPDGTIVVLNPNSDVYISAHAANKVGPCGATMWLEDKKWLKISGCDKDTAVTVTFTSRLQADDGIYGGEHVTSSVVKCVEIPATGVPGTVTQGLAPHISTGAEVPVAVHVDVISALRLTSALGEVQTTVTVGDQLYWTIDVPEAYSATVPSCTAFAGTSLAGTPTKLLMKDGCTAVADLVASFSNAVVTDIPGVKRYVTTMWAFKFQSNDHVFLQCEVKLCPDGSPHCDINCDSRKRRSTDLGAGTGVAYSTTSRVLKVRNPVAEIMYISSSKSRLHQDLAIACAVTLACWLLKTMFV